MEGLGPAILLFILLLLLLLLLLLVLVVAVAPSAGDGRVLGEEDVEDDRHDDSRQLCHFLLLLWRSCVGGERLVGRLQLSLRRNSF